MSATPRILIVRLSSIGDILHAVPALRSLRAAFPEAQIDWLVEKRMRFVLSAVPGISEILELDTQSWRQSPLNFASLGEFWKLLRRMRTKRYDISLDFQGLTKTALLAYLSGASTRVGFDRTLVRERPADWFYNRTLGSPKNEQHIVQLNQALAQMAGGLPVSLTNCLKATADDHQLIESRLKADRISQYVIINPGGGWPTKRWKPAKYGELAARIQMELKLDVVVTTGPGEEHLYDEICYHCSDTRPRHLALPLLQLIPLCLKARLFIGGDTGPFQLASALGTPAVGIFGPTSPVRNGPLSPRDETVVHVLHCSFCNGRTCPTQNECMDITVEEVFEAVQRRLSKEEQASRGVVA